MNTAFRERITASYLTRGYLICLVATTLWSTNAIFIRYLNQTYQMPPLVLAFWRDFIVTIVLGIILTVFNPHRLHLDRKNFGFIFLYGISLTLLNSLWTISVTVNGAAVSTVLAYSSAAYTAVLGWRFLGESLSRLKIIAVTLSLLGCIFVAGAYDPSTWLLNPLGVVTGLASGLCFAFYTLCGRSASKRSIDPWTGLLYSFAIASAFLFLLNLVSAWLPTGAVAADFFWLGDALAGWLVLFILAVLPTLGGYGLYMVSLTYLPASIANILATLEPVLTAILAYLLLAERFTSPQVIGSLLIISGIVVLALRSERAAAQEAF